jgi:hypothetical protein
VTTLSERTEKALRGAIRRAQEKLAPQGRAVLIENEDDGVSLYELAPDGTKQFIAKVKAPRYGVEKPSGKGAYHFAKKLQARDVATLEAFGLPKYWNEDWLKEQWCFHGSYEAIAKANNLNESGMVIALYAKAHYGWNVDGLKAYQRWLVVQDYFAKVGERPSMNALAEKYGVAPSRVHAWVNEALEGKLGEDDISEETLNANPLIVLYREQVWRHLFQAG